MHRSPNCAFLGRVHGGTGGAAPVPGELLDVAVRHVHAEPVHNRNIERQTEAIFKVDEKGTSLFAVRSKKSCPIL